jgi:hypothetical protein
LHNVEINVEGPGKVARLEYITPAPLFRQGMQNVSQKREEEEGKERHAYEPPTSIIHHRSSNKHFAFLITNHQCITISCF